MEEDVNQQRLQDYRERMTGWIGRQGLLFQIRYLRLAGGGSLATRFVGFFTILAIWIFVILVVSFGTLKIYQKSGAFQERLTGRVGGAFGAEDVAAKGFFKSAGNAGYQTIKLEGGEESFFYEARFSDLEGPFAFFSNALREWTPKTVLLRKAEVSLRAGGTREEMEKAFGKILSSLDGEGPTRIKVADFNCEWGYSKLTFGGIYKAKFDASLVEGRWEITLEGGYFRQNWLGPMVIEEGALVVTEKGLQVESLRLSESGGTMDLAGSVRGPLNLPDVSLKGKFTAIPVEKLFQVQGVPEKRFLEGPISGELEISGSTNRSIQTAGKVVLQEDDVLRIRDEWKLVRAISTVSRDGTYLRIGFGKGSFQFTTGRGSLEVSGIDLVAEGVAKLEGSFTSRLLNQKEAADYLDITLTSGFSKSLTDTSAAQILKDRQISLTRAGKAAREGEDEFEISLDTKSEIDEVIENQANMEELDGLRLEREMKKPRYDGRLRLGLPADLFKSTPTVLSSYATEDQGWLWLPIEMNAVKFPEISLAEGQKLLRQGQAYQSESDESP